MKTLKFAVFSFIILSSITAAVIYYAFSHIDDHIIDVVEEVGDDVTQSKVEVDRAVVNLQYGSGSLYNLSLKNPPTYSDKVLYVSNRVAFKVDMSTLNAPVMVINKVDVKDSYIYIETASDPLTVLGNENAYSNSNLQAVLAVLDRVSNESGDMAKSTIDSAITDSQSLSTKVMIERITFADATIEWEKTGDPDTLRTLVSPGFFLENIGDRVDGLTRNEAARIILRALFSSIQATIQQPQKTAETKEEDSGFSAQDLLGEQLNPAP